MDVTYVVLRAVLTCRQKKKNVNTPQRFVMYLNFAIISSFNFFTKLQNPFKFRRVFIVYQGMPISHLFVWSRRAYRL